MRIRAWFGAVVEGGEGGTGNPAQLHHTFNRQSPIGLHFFFDLPVDRGFPVNACSIRCSSMRCKHPFKKSISRACWPILRSNSAMRPSAQRCFPLPGNALPGPVRNSRRQRCSTLGLTSNARAASPIETPCSSRRTAASLNSLVNNLRDNPMTQFSFKWILSLNCLCQNCGQVQIDLWLEWRSQTANQRLRQLHLFRIELPLSSSPGGVGLTQFIHVIQGVEHHSILSGTNDHDVLTAVH